ncbi:hypothetical protein BpHYR1_030837 [Brachionus plicatilis]|uniref:RNA-directed DNA polymerase from mobile element jockey-like n=1 Tax=Brachionus plicatilis TaxID=10195 RepID=A0A3M7QW44_BRAPC|nr:hypothetical protein BpHYR1_030837 [Brachionus plicatilis]
MFNYCCIIQIIWESISFNFTICNNNLKKKNAIRTPFFVSQSAEIVEPVASTRGHTQKVRLQSFTSREINDYHKYVNARMHFFSSRAAVWWNLLPAFIVEANSINRFKARLDAWLLTNGTK